jgi:hypothetical protein
MAYLNVVRRVFMKTSVNEIDLLDRSLDKHTGSKRRHFMSRLPSLVITMMLITLGVELPAKQASAAPTQITACQTISTPGSYILANNLNANGNCLSIGSSFVTINFNGFAVTGNGTGFGVSATGFPKGIAIRNGTIRNFSIGVSLQSDSLVERMYITDNTVIGVTVEGSSIVRDNIITDNGTGLSAGSSLGPGTIVTGNTVARNFNGVRTGTSSIVIGNVSTSSENGDGFQVGSSSLVINNVSTNNRGSIASGFNVFSLSLVENNTASANGLFGFVVTCPSKVVNNTAGGDGLNLFGSPPCIDKDNLP